MEDGRHEHDGNRGRKLTRSTRAEFLKLTHPTHIDMTNPPRPEPWHIKREIQIGHLVTTLAVAFSVIWYAGKLEQRVALVEQAVVSQRERDASQDSAAALAYQQTQKQLERIDAKLDRLIELRVKKP